ncbi:MAG: hypothetical protein HFG76_13065 [Hungatella sp.]|nr:hypothetical protein [Hungatella sp.]
MFTVKNTITYNGANDPTASRIADTKEILKLKNLSYEERLKRLSTSGWTSFNWADKLLAARS